MSDSLLRQAEHEALSKVELHGQVLDLGGDKRSAYRNLIRGTFEITTVNLAAKSQPDILHDLELPLPMADATYDAVLMVNVLEHVYLDQQLLTEAARVLKPGGTVVVVVPFLFPVHPSPSDFRRYTGQALEQLLSDAGFLSVKITSLGRGVWSARHLMINRLLPTPLRQLHSVICGSCARVLDWLTTSLAKALGRRYEADHYALGYLVEARNIAI